jgi:beta-barrel assembly-enhancing protease
VIRASLLCLLAALPLQAVPADTLPDLGDVSQATLSPAQERGIGFNIMRQIRQSSSYLDDPEVSDYLNQVGYRLVAVSPDARQDFLFFPLQDNSVNAFALPGGYVGIHAGLILTAQSESELAAVMAHEVAHVTQRHIARMVASQQKQGMVSLAAVAIAILAARSNPQAAVGAIAASQAQALSNQLAFSRDNERDADRVGVQILERSGFDTHAMPVFLDRLQRSTRSLENGAPSYMRTHPITYERIADVQGRIYDLPYRQVPDSLEFHLVRAKLRAMQKEPRDAVAYFDDLVTERKFANETAARYGLITALLRARDHVRAAKESKLLPQAVDSHPMLASMQGRILAASGKTQQAIEWYRKQIVNFPNQRTLVYALAQALLDSKRPADANAVIDARLQQDPDDGRLYEMQANAYSALGQSMMKHRSLAESYVAQGNLQLAMEQLQLALKNNNGDFYEVSGIEARLSQLRTLTAKQQ